MINEKLNIKWRSTDTGVRPKRAAIGRPGERLISITTRKDKKSNGAYGFISLTFHARAIAKAQWQVGDRIALEYDNGTVLLSKDNAGTKLGMNHTGSHRPTMLIRVVPECVQMFRGMQASAIEIENGRMAFVLKGE